MKHPVASLVIFAVAETFVVAVFHPRAISRRMRANAEVRRDWTGETEASPEEREAIEREGDEWGRVASPFGLTLGTLLALWTASVA